MVDKQVSMFEVKCTHTFYCQSSESMSQLKDETIALTITSPPYWHSIDYEQHAKTGTVTDYKEKNYEKFGESYDDWLNKIETVFNECYRVTMQGGFCAIVIGTLLKDGKQYPAPFDVLQRMQTLGWQFQESIIWNKVTKGVKRAGTFIKFPVQGYYYPNILIEYILVFRKGDHLKRGSVQEIVIDDLFKKDIANNIWHIAPVQQNAIDHPCPYPDEIVRRLCLLYSIEGDTLLDPFLGSGQTAKVALQYGRSVVGYEIEAAYVRLAESHIKDTRQRPRQLLPFVESRPFSL